MDVNNALLLRPRRLAFATYRQSFHSSFRIQLCRIFRPFRPSADSNGGHSRMLAEPVSTGGSGGRALQVQLAVGARSRKRNSGSIRWRGDRLWGLCPRVREMAAWLHRSCRTVPVIPLLGRYLSRPAARYPDGPMRQGLTHARLRASHSERGCARLAGTTARLDDVGRHSGVRPRHVGDIPHGYESRKPLCERHRALGQSASGGRRGWGNARPSYYRLDNDPGSASGFCRDYCDCYDSNVNFFSIFLILRK